MATNIDGAQRVTAPLRTGEAPGEWTAVKFVRCSNGHEYPLAAGDCPFDHEETALRLVNPDSVPILDKPRALALDVSGGPRTAGPASTMLAEWVASPIVQFVDNGKVPRTWHTYGHSKPIGWVSHIPVAPTLTSLTNYFTGQTAEPPQGSTHFGIGRDREWTYRIPGTHILFPCATVHQYLPLTGVSPWAQGAILRRAGARIPLSPTVANMRQGEPNGAFVSAEFVAMDWTWGVTDEQFNSGALLRAYCADKFGFAINPLTQLWHSEIDQVNRPNDPGWDLFAAWDIETEMQEAAKKLLKGDHTGLRGWWSDAPAPTPPTPPAPPKPPTPSDDITKYRLVPEGEAVVHSTKAHTPTYHWTDDPAIREERQRVELELRKRVRIVRD